MPLACVVNGRTITSSAPLLLKRSSETTSTGRLPDCSCPRTGSRSASQRSPRRGSGTFALRSVHVRDGPILVPDFVPVEVVHQRRVPFFPLFHLHGPGSRIGAESLVGRVRFRKEPLAVVLLD